MKSYWKVNQLLKNYGARRLFLAVISEIYRKIWLEFINGSYAQNGEDLVVEKIFGKNYIGNYLEIGAYHPIRLSNTYRFYKKGWRGKVIEPNPEIRPLFEIFRPEDEFLNIGISDKNQKLNYFQFLIPAINTFSQNEANDNKKKGHVIQKITKIETKKIEEIVDEEVDFLSIDTEGFDEKILRCWPWKKYDIKVICVETDKDGDRIKSFLKKQGYKLYFQNKFNSIFVGKKLKLGDDRRQ
jgi:FkbM family methyltransferase